MDQQDRSPAEAVDPRAFADAIENSEHSTRPPLRLGAAVASAVVAALAVVGAVIVPQMIHNPSSLLGLGQATGSQSGQAGSPAVGSPSLLPSDAATSSYPLTYASHLIAGPDSGCCFSSGGSWAASATGGYPGGSGPVRTSTDPGAWSEWALGQPAGGYRWDQVKIRVWLPAAGAGAWVRFTVTATAGGASNVSTFDLPEQQYEGWYELPATFMIGSPARRTGSLWLRMTYLRPYQYQDPGCADGSCRRMAAAQAEFLWS